MNNQYKTHYLRKGLDDKFKSYSNASKQKEELSQESRTKYEKYYDAILLYSAGSFSFTVALIGLVVSNKVKALSTVTLFFPNIYWLYISWVAFALACLAVLLSKRFNAAYVVHFGIANYAKAYREYEEEQLHVVKSGMENSIFEDSAETFEKTKLSNVKLLESAEHKQSNRERFTYKVFYCSHLVSEVTATIGLITLLLFSVFLSQAIVWQK